MKGLDMKLEDIKPVHDFTPTDEQLDVIDAVINTDDNLLISALAGAAKTSTLVMIANEPDMAHTSILCLAFNKRIKDEMEKRLPGNCVALTLNSLGHRVWGQHLGMRLKVNTRKNYEIMQEEIKEFSHEDQNFLYDNFSELLRIVGHGKSCGWVPDEVVKDARLSLVDDMDFFAGLDDELEDVEQELVTNCMLTSIKLAHEGAIDFDDQIYMSVCFGGAFPTYDITLIDEAQDLSGLNHAMLKLIVKDRRIIAVGDPFQAIYAFRGAHSDSMDRLQRAFEMEELNLTISFRCPKSVVAAAQWRAPYMRYPDWAEEGKVRSLTDWTIETLPEHCTIICRNNAPIYNMAMAILSEGRFPEIVGNDIGKALLKIMKKLGKTSMLRDEVMEKLEAVEKRRLSRAREWAKSAIRDQFECIRIFVRSTDNLGQAIARAEHLMTSTGSIQMMTGHKSKGLEYDDVFILDRDLLKLIDSDQPGSKNQDRNLLYVMQTRAMKTLTYVESDNFVKLEGIEDGE